jgi:ABC-type multidrug transport system ATPase subunit
MKQTLIRLKNVSIGYTENQLINKVNLDINRGDAIAITGHNGAGKSTLLNVLMGFKNQTQGVIERNNVIKINYIPEKMPQIALKTRDYLRHIGKIKGIESFVLDKKIETLSKELFIDAFLNTPVKYLSKGSQQKVNVIQSFLNIPDLLVLDEPLSGQDADSQKKFISMTKQYINNGGTLIMSCHENYLIKSLANRLLEIKNNNLISVNPPDQSCSFYQIFLAVPYNDPRVHELLKLFPIKSETYKNMLRLTVSKSMYKEVLKTIIAKNIDIERLEHEEI